MITQEQRDAFRRDIAAVCLKHGLFIDKEPCCSPECWGNCGLRIEQLGEGQRNEDAVLELLPGAE
jgi:hypothetical protein